MKWLTCSMGFFQEILTAVSKQQQRRLIELAMYFGVQFSQLRFQTVRADFDGGNGIKMLYFMYEVWCTATREISSFNVHRIHVANAGYHSSTTVLQPIQSLL